jgi:hypothetical protein
MLKYFLNCFWDSVVMNGILKVRWLKAWMWGGGSLLGDGVAQCWRCSGAMLGGEVDQS